MMLRGKIARTSLDQIIGIVACAGAAGPIFLLIYTIGLLLSPVNDVGDLWSQPLSDLLRGCATASILFLPTVIAIAIGAYALARWKKDTFMMSVACGAAIGFIATCITSEIVVGGSSLTEAGNVDDAALLMLGSVLMSSLHWLVTVRRIRNRRELAEQHERAIRAME